MRYRIQIQPMLGATLVVITKVAEYNGTVHHTTKMYTLPEELHEADGLVEALGELQRVIGESEG